eukprot:8455314-Lingulodinium_polyedra.AAC.1
MVSTRTSNRPGSPSPRLCAYCTKPPNEAPPLLLGVANRQSPAFLFGHLTDEVPRLPRTHHAEEEAELAFAHLVRP